jgi:hypothetical protein
MESKIEAREMQAPAYTCIIYYTLKINMEYPLRNIIAFLQSGHYYNKTIIEPNGTHMNNFQEHIGSNIGRWKSRNNPSE